MNHLSAIALVIVFIFAGCRDAAKTVSEDSPRLERIDRRFEAGDFDYALREAAKYVQAYPRSFKGWGLLGWAYLKTDQLEKAQECFDKSLRINPQWENAHVGKG